MCDDAIFVSTRTSVECTEDIKEEINERKAIIDTIAGGIGIEFNGETVAASVIIAITYLFDDSRHGESINSRFTFTYEAVAKAAYSACTCTTCEPLP